MRLFRQEELAMLRIVGVHKDELAQNEFVLLQNQGHMRVTLKGHVIMSDSMVQGSNEPLWHVFSDEEAVPAGLYVLLSSGSGQPHWARTKDGAHVYHTYMNRTDSVWNHAQLPLHVLAQQHSYSVRSEVAVSLH